MYIVQAIKLFMQGISLSPESSLESCPGFPLEVLTSFCEENHLVQYFVSNCVLLCLHEYVYMALFQINFSNNSHLSAESHDVSGIHTQLEEELRKLKRSTNLRRKVLEKTCSVGSTGKRSAHYCYEDGRRKRKTPAPSRPTSRRPRRSEGSGV